MAVDVMQICTKYGDRLYAAAFNICRQRQDAEDAVQEALLRYFRSEKEFESEEHVKAWLIRVTVNVAKSMRTSFWHKNRVAYEDYMEEIPFENEADRDLMQVVLSLPDQYRIIVHLYYYEGYKTREIAEILQLSENTVKTRLVKSRKILRKELEGWEDDEKDEQ